MVKALYYKKIQSFVEMYNREVNHNSRINRKNLNYKLGWQNNRTYCIMYNLVQISKPMRL